MNFKIFGMKHFLFASFSLITTSFFAQIEYPGTASTVGSAAVVFDYSVSNCNQLDIPDAPARAYKDASGKIQLIASHYVSWRMRGNDFSSLTKDCNSIMTSTPMNKESW